MCSQMFTNVPKCDTFFCDSTPFEGAFGTNVTFVTLDPPLFNIITYKELNGVLYSEGSNFVWRPKHRCKYEPVIILIGVNKK